MTRDIEAYNAWRRKRYRENKEFRERDKERIRKHDDERIKFVNDYKSNHPCPFCGEDNPACLDFHHLDRDVC
jgi:hypothetical protein